MYAKRDRETGRRSEAEDERYELRVSVCLQDRD